MDDDEDVVEGSSRGNWHARLPDAPKELLKSADLSLTREEALYLRERIRQKQGDSLLSYLINGSWKMQGTLPWLHPAAATLPARLAKPLEHARLFSETMHGAALLYNLQLTEALPPGGERERSSEALRAELHEWCAELEARSSAISSWDHDEFWKRAKDKANVRGSTENFVNSWWKLQTWRDPDLAISSVAARELIGARERSLKGSRARLGNQRALELWNGTAGLSRLNYRWAVTTVLGLQNPRRRSDRKARARAAPQQRRRASARAAQVAHVASGWRSGKHGRTTSFATFKTAYPKAIGAGLQHWRQSIFLRRRAGT